MAASSASSAPLVDSTRRYDYLPLYNGNNPAVSSLADAVHDKLARIAQDHHRIPRLFSYARDLPADRRAIFEAIWQTRGGGTVLVILSEDFFGNQWCVAALMAVLDVQRGAIRSAMLKLRFVCREGEVAAVRDIGRRIFPHLFTQYDVHAIAAATGAAMAYYTARRIWEAWEGIATGERPSALGGTVHKAFLQLGRVFTSDDLPLLGSVLQIDTTAMLEVTTVLQAAIRNNVIGWYNVKELRKVVMQNTAAPADQRLEALDVYQERWEGCNRWVWSRQELQSAMTHTLAAAKKAVNGSQALSERGPEPRAPASPASSGNATGPRYGTSIEKVVLQASALPPRPAATYVPGVEDTERAEHKLKAVLTSSTGAARSVGPRAVVVGLGGSGKSDACKGVALDADVCDRFHNGIVWIQLSSAANEATVANAIIVLVASLLRNDDAAQRGAVESLLCCNDFDDLQQKAQLHVANSLSGMRDFAGQALVIVDDAWEYEHVNALVSIVPQECGLVVTTRLPSAVVGVISSASEVKMSDMPVHAAETLLGKIMGRTEPFSDLERERFVNPMLGETGLLPLGIVIVASMVREAGNAWRPIMERLQKAGIVDEEACAMPPGMKQGGEMHVSLRAALDVSTERIADDEGRLAFRLLGVLPVNITVEVEVVQKVWAGIDVVRMVRRLGDLGLVRVIVDEGVGEMRGIEVHTVTGAYALSELRRGGEEKSAHQKVIDAYKEERGYAGKIARSGFDFLPLWEIDDDRYFADNIVRHAEGAGDAGVATCVVDRRWRDARDRQKAGIAFNEDLEVAIRILCGACEGMEYAEDDHREARGSLYFCAGAAYIELRKGDRMQSIEDAIEMLQKSLELCPKSSFPTVFATASNSIGIAFIDRVKGDKGENVESAIAHLMAALSVWKKEEEPDLWAIAKCNLGLAHVDRIGGKHEANVEEAIACYEASLTVVTAETYPEQWGDARHNLGVAYGARTLGEPSENIEAAIRHYRAALTVHTRERRPVKWATTQNSLGIAYGTRVQGSRQENVEAAISHYKAALSVFDRDAFPAMWAMVKDNLGSAYASMVCGDRAENVAAAVQCYKEALTVRTRAGDPSKWASTMYNLGNAYANMVCGDRAESVAAAVQCYKEALTVRTRAGDPSNWADTMYNLGNAYKNMVCGDRAENVAAAVQCYKEALTVYTRAGDPSKWANTTNNLGSAYNNMVCGDRAENVAAAVQCYKEALTVRTRAGDPSNWADTMYNLGNAYANMVCGDGAENVGAAVQCYKEALTVRTRAGDPSNWADTMHNLGKAYADMVCGDRAENVAAAVQCYKEALTVRTRAGDPSNWADTMYNLGNAYANMVCGDRAENVGAAVQCYKEALTGYTRAGDPSGWANTMYNMMLVHYYAGDASAALEVAEELHAALANVQSLSDERRESVRMVIDSREQCPESVSHESSGSSEPAVTNVERSNGKLQKWICFGVCAVALVVAGRLRRGR